MATLLHDLIMDVAWKQPQQLAVRCEQSRLTYGQLAQGVERAARAFLSLGLKRDERVAVLLDKRAEALLAMFGALGAGAAFVPVDPMLKSEQAGLVLRDSGARMLVTTPTRRLALSHALARCPDLRCVLQTGAAGAAVPGLAVFGWDDCLRHAAPLAAARGADTGMAALVYSCGSSGKPRATMLSHRSVLEGAARLGEMLGRQAQQADLCLLPLSCASALGFLACSFGCAGTALLVNDIPAREVPQLAGREGVTMVAAAPWLWMQAAALDWHGAQALRNIISVGGVLPRPTLDALRRHLPQTETWLLPGRLAGTAGEGEHAALTQHPGARSEQYK
ncbi:AMP-binding protein [Massilia sp. TSP1-1-2]|uniref:AMP-binding protein n=1 Tax=unclassified Massilia TaxID=2609279 RepID=UPI003CF5B2D9